MSDALGPGDLVLCVNAAPNHVTGEPVPLVAGETYRVLDLWEFACPCGRSDALIDVGVGWAWCQSRFRKLPKPKARERVRRTAKPKVVEPAGWTTRIGPLRTLAIAASVCVDVACRLSQRLQFRLDTSGWTLCRTR